MVTVAHLAENIVRKKPFLEEALHRGIINYVALAILMKPEIERELKKEVKTSAIAMALRRMSETKRALPGGNICFGEADITIKSDLFEMTVMKSSQTIDNIRKVYALVDFSRGDFLTITYGLYEIAIIASKNHKAKIEKIFENEKILMTIPGLSSLTIKMPVDAIETIGLIYSLTKALSWENITIIEIVSTLTEMIFILKEDDVSRAFVTMKTLIAESESASA